MLLRFVVGRIQRLTLLKNRSQLAVNIYSTKIYIYIYMPTIFWQGGISGLTKSKYGGRLEFLNLGLCIAFHGIGDYAKWVFHADRGRPYELYIYMYNRHASSEAKYSRWRNVN